MPGLNFVFSFKEPIENKSQDYKAAVEQTMSEEFHSIDVLYEDEQLLSSITSHENYPTRTFENNETKFCIEGRIYNLDDDSVNKTIISITERLFKGDETAKSDLSDWLSSVDGEFLIFVYNKSEKRILLINDIFSLLPCYIHKTDWGVVFSRSFPFTATMVEQKKFDKIAMAQFLMFRHTIGDRTYLKDVYRLKPAELITIDACSENVQREVLYTFNCDEKEHSNKSTKENAAELAKLFTQGCRNRIDPNCKTIALLSGGLDSRAMTAALQRENTEFDALTILDPNSIAETDFKLAQQVASELDVNWKPIELKPMPGKNMLRLLRMKFGMVCLGKDFIIQIADNLTAEHGCKVSPFLGLGGDRSLHDIRSTGSNKIDSLKDYLHRTPYFMPSEMALRLTGVSETEFFEEIQKELNSYPEKTTIQKYVHFWYYGQTFKWLFEDHDRFRSFSWPASPFFSTQFFRYAINCPDSQKTFLRLYYYFLNTINPKMSEIPSARNLYKTAIDLARSRSLVWYWYCHASQMCKRIRKWPNPIRFVFKKVKKLTTKANSGIKDKYEHSPNIIKCISEQVSNCRKNPDLLIWTEIDEVLKNNENYNSESFSHLLTVTSMIEKLTTGKSTLEKYQDSTFGSYNPILSRNLSITENF